MKCPTGGRPGRSLLAAVARAAGALVVLAACGEGAPAGGEGAAVEQDAVAAAPGARTWDFDAAAPGALPDGVRPLVGRWSTADDPARAGNRVLAQLAVNEDDVFNVALVEGTQAADLDLSVRLRAVAGVVDQGGGLVWRAADERNYYIARFNPLEDNVRVYVVQDGRRRQLDTELVHLDPHAWHELRVSMRGDHVTCRLDGRPVLEARDATFPAAGRVGLWTKADAVTHFDDLALVER